VNTRRRKGLGLMGKKEAMVGALLRAVCTNIYNPVENLSMDSCDGGFLWSFRE
jgi:hypothetical protein